MRPRNRRNRHRRNTTHGRIRTSHLRIINTPHRVRNPTRSVGGGTRRSPNALLQRRWRRLSETKSGTKQQSNDPANRLPLIAAPTGECAEWKGSLAPRDLLPRGARSSLPRKGDEMTCKRTPNHTQETNPSTATSGRTHMNSAVVNIADTKNT